MEPSDGAGDSSLGGGNGGEGLPKENLVVRCAKNEPMPAPHVEAAGFASAAGRGFEALRLNGRMPLGGAAGGCGDASGEENMLVESRMDRMLAASDFDTSTVLLEALLAGAPETLDEELPLRCIQRPRTLSTALKKPVEASVNVREMASRVGANCCSSLSS